MRRHIALILIMCGLGGCDRSSGEAQRSITVFAAASTAEPVRAAALRFEEATGISVSCSFAATSSLARQIAAGAPADVFLSADERWMDELIGAGDVRPETRHDLLANQLVLIAPADSTLVLEAERGGIPDLSAVDRIALADPAHVPAGRYAQQALTWLGWWEAIEDRVIPMRDVRAALHLVELGEADLGIVYATDVIVSDAVRVLASLPPASHDPIRYPVAVCTGARDGAGDFTSFLLTDDVREIFTKAGFDVSRTSEDERIDAQP